MSDNYSSDTRRLTTGDIVFIIASAILFLGAIGIFIWLLVDAAEQHLVRNLLFGSAFLLITLGLVIFSLATYNHPRTARGVMWTTLIAGLAVYVVGLCIYQSAPEPDVAVGDEIVPLTDVAAIDSIEAADGIPAE